MPMCPGLTVAHTIFFPVADLNSVAKKKKKILLLYERSATCKKLYLMFVLVLFRKMNVV